jgi:hypothetical protein
MAEEVQQEQQPEGNDFEKVTGFIRDQVKAYIGELQQQQPQQQQPQYDQRQYEQNRLVAETIAPVVGPALAQATNDAADARDEIRFYRENPEALEHSEAVERLFGELKQQGRLIPRRDLYDAILGREFRADPEKFVEKQQARKKQQTERAELSTDFGAAMMNKVKADSTWGNFENLSLEDMEKKLEGVTF